MIEKKLKKTIEKIFPKSKIPKKIRYLKHGSFESWDSLKHYNLLLQIEEDFKIKFSFRQMSELKNVDEILKLLKKN